MTTAVFEPSVREAPPRTEREWPPQGKWTYEDYRRLPDDGWRYEIIGGELYMTPAPEPIHQEYGGEMFAAFRDYAKKHDAGKAYIAPKALTRCSANTAWAKTCAPKSCRASK